MTLSTRSKFSVLRMGITLVGILLLFHFYVHPWLTGQLSAVSAQLPSTTTGLLSNPTQAAQHVVNGINSAGKTLP